MNTKEELIENIKNIIENKGIENPIVNFDIPNHHKLGDYSTSVALAYAKKLGSKPVALAMEIKEELVRRMIKHILRIDIIEPGFINFFFDAHFFAKDIGKVALTRESFKNQKVIIEYTDPNPFKEFHIGHLMPNVIGESISRILEINGAEVKRANYQGDIGLHVAKAVWARWKELELDDGIEFVWGKYYSLGNTAYIEDPIAKKEIIEINKKIYNGDINFKKIYDLGRRESLEHFEIMYQKLDTKFDYYFFESETAEFGKEIVEKNIPEVFEKSDGAIVFRGESHDKKLHTRVFINSEGLPTYEAKELGLSKIKYNRYPYDLSVVVTGNEINEYFKVLLKAMSLVFPDLAQKTKHLSHGMLRLPEGKMSSRTGNIISAEFLIDQVKRKVLEKMADIENVARFRLATDEIAEIVAVGAIKYSILRQAIGGDIVFDFDKSISFEGDSGPYLQYTTVRANSLLKKAEGSVSVSDELPNEWETTNLERLLERFSSVVSRAGTEYAPHHIVTYLTELAGEFNSFYANHKIIDEKDKTSPYRLALTKAFAQVMTTGLELLGIKVPEKM